MRIKKAIVRASVVASIGAMAAIAPAAPALAGTPPTCMQTVKHAYNSVTVYNRCGLTSFNIRIVWRAAPDSGCYTISPGSSRAYNAFGAPLGSYDKTVTC
ncbi:hypothetical protein [Plantactinospora soyae]|uniref:Alpha amylase inhibitor n=1 Tax=Plantactinospora soyae TaxID=1544732 RepID=A0A927M8B2_9ACTN|nr:hypothetical protein [Plantactinospora soyae]MBE1490023.1 hypothetical protein [Plantactinospora soyae]